MSETLASDAERASGLFHLVRLVPRRLSVLHLRYLHVLAHLIEVLLGLFELPNIPDGQKNGSMDSSGGRTPDFGHLEAPKSSM